MKQFLLNNKNIEKNSVIWNMAGSLLMAIQSVIFLMVLTRVTGLNSAGVFTIAYANANLFLTISNFGMRYYQVSDLKHVFEFNIYKKSRIVTWFISMLAVIIYLFIVQKGSEYTSEKLQITFWMCFFKSVDAAEDVYHGRYQQQGRLDVAGRCLTVRMVATIMFFVAVVIMSKNLLTATFLTAIFTSIICISLLFMTFPEFSDGSDCRIPENVSDRDCINDVKRVNIRNDRHGVLKLLMNCLPLFVGSFFSFYIGNASKYAIDAELNSKAEACFGFIAMPVFVVGLLNGFIFNPVIYKLSVMWKERNISGFFKRIAIQILIVIMITFICVIGAWMIGIPVLSWLYSTDLHIYKNELIILLIGGGLLGLAGLLNTVLTIIRFQQSVAVGYGIVALLAFVFSDSVVRKYNIKGAAWLYTGLMAFTCILFLLFLVIGVHIRLSSDERTD